MLRGVALLTWLHRGLDPRANIRARTRQLVEMSRYSRAGTPGELLGWDDVDLVRFRELYKALCEVVSSESQTKSWSEET